MCFCQLGGGFDTDVVLQDGVYLVDGDVRVERSGKVDVIDTHEFNNHGIGMCKEFRRRALAKAEASEREKMKPRELRRQMLDVVNRPVEVIMKEGTSRDFDVGTFVPSNTFALDAELENEAEYMDQLEDSDYADAGINAAGVPVDLDANNEADAVETGEDGDVNSAGDDAEPPIQLDFSEEELQAEEELPIEHDQI